jgi:macrolide-specific efflux system membrane fusion protein
MSLSFLYSRRSLLFILLFVLLGVAGWFTRPPPPDYSTVPVTRSDVQARVASVATLLPRNSVEVGAQVSGQIMRLHVEAGDRVEKGQLLAEIDASLHEATVEADRASLKSLQAQLQEQLAQLLLARQQYNRQMHMARFEATTEEDVQIVVAEYKVAQARLEDLKAQISERQAQLKGNETQLSYTRLYAPISGTVLAIDVKMGQTLNATYQTPRLMTIADLSRMTGWARVSEADISRVKPGQPLYFSTLGNHQRRWHSAVRQILPAPTTTSSTDAATGSVSTEEEAVQYTVLYDVDNRDGELMPQMTAEVMFITASAKDVLTIPLSALQGDREGYHVRVLRDDHHLELRPVKIGIRDRQTVEILDGLREAEQLVTGEILSNTAVSRFQW